jgi:SulP family sulfate permease
MTGRLGWLFKRVPALDALRDYSWQALGGDLTAGITVATVAVPQAMAYATLAGVPPEHGLYTAIVMTGVGALFDSSRQLINGPTNAISIALLSALAVMPPDDRIHGAILLALLVGAVQLGIALLRLGDLSRYVSPSVIVGFTVGAGTLLVLDQMKNLLGLEPRGLPEDHFLKRFWLSLTDGGGVRGPTFLIGVSTIAMVVAVRGINGVLRRRGARFPIPQHLVAVTFMAALVWAFELDRNYRVEIVGPIPAALPRFRLPQVTWEETRQLAGNAFAIALLGLLEAIAMAKSIAARTGQKLDINQQCISEGAANLAGSFFQCFPGSGSLTRSAVNQQAGAVSQWSGVFAAIAVAGTVLLIAPLAQYIPRASLAGLLMLAAFRMVDREQLVFHLRATRFDAGVVIATALAAVAISVEFCILIGVFLSFVLYVPRAAQVRMTQLVRMPDQRVRPRQPGERIDDELLIYHLEGELFFGTEPDLEAHCAAIAEAAHGKIRAVILVLQRARNPDAAFLMLLRSLDRRLRQRGVTLVLCGVAADMDATFACTGIRMQIGDGRIFCEPAPGCTEPTEVPSACYLLQRAECATCPRRQQPEAAGAPLNYTI